MSDALPPRRYLILIACSAAATVLLALGLAAYGPLDLAHVSRLRDVLGYGHFALAYIFAWRLVRRQLGRRRAAAYLAIFAAVMTLYAIAQRSWMSLSINVLFVMAVFMTHHAANDVLFREQSRNGYQPFRWTPRGTLWVALVVLLVFIDRLGNPVHPWHAATPAFIVAWIIGWLVYGRRHVWPNRGRLLTSGGWILAGAFGAWCIVHPTRQLAFASQYRFSWIVIYHYVAWYVFYLQKLLARTGGWRPAWRPSPSSLWRFATTVPVGFLGLIVIGNAIVLGLYLVTDPLATWMARATQLDFFQLNTIAHILFGAGVPSLAAATDAPSPCQTREPLPQFA